MRTTKWFFGSLLAVSAIWLTSLSGTPRPALLAEKTADYLEDEGGGRILAEIHARLTATRLDLRISAVGPRVDPIPGYRGVAGSNHITARELESLVRNHNLSVVTRRNGQRLLGTYAPGRRMRIPERRFEAGRLIVDAKTEHEVLVELDARARLFGPGEQSVYLVVGLTPRLRVDVVIGRDGSGRILDIVSLAEHPVRTHQ